MKTVIEKYKKRQQKYTELVQKQNKLSNIISFIRFVVFFLGTGLSIYFYVQSNYYIFASSLLSTIIVFSYTVYLHIKVKRNIKYFAIMSDINENSMKRVNGEWQEFADNGEDFLDEKHSYSYDLDIFGKGSLFQWINSAYTFAGRNKLKNSLIDRPKDIKSIYERQEAVEELSKRLYIRQKFASEGIIKKGDFNNPDELIKWAEDNHQTLSNFKIVFLRIMPIITISSIILSSINYISFYIPSTLILFQSILLVIGIGKRNVLFNTAEKYSDDIKTYKNMLNIIEKQSFKSSYLSDLKSKIYIEGCSSPTKQITAFSKIVEFIASRRNLYYSIFNMVFMLDYQLLINLEKWKNKSGKYIRQWIECIGEFESISSLSNIKFGNPTWCTPKITDEKSTLISNNMGHPLISTNRISNDVTIKEPNAVLLITGSNMSGKSTLLRTTGINLVLAYSGAPVCADRFTSSLMDIYTCMRTSDNLENNVSSFYAEILKIKNIVNASNEGKQVFFLLDEIFKGTNSIDRHTGATVLIEQLSKAKNIGLVSTHDLELGDLENKANSKVKNYHFSEYYKDDKIYFDYKLKPGVSNTRNAIYLMKLAGIKIDN